MQAAVLFVELLIVTDILGIVLHSTADIADEINQLKREVDAVKVENAQLKAKLQALENARGSASTYVRWGRTICSGNGTDLVYKGYSAGHHYTDNTGGAEFLCLPHDVQWPTTGSSHSLDGRIYGTEYELYNGLGHYDQDAPCCLCKTNRATVVMIPARTTCFPGWTTEYTGYLAAGQRTASLTNYVCVDAHAEDVPGGGVDNNEAVIHNVQAQCGSLPCPPYVDSKQLACVVCSI